VRTHSPLVIDVTELLESHGSRKVLEFVALIDGLQVGLSGANPEMRFELVAEHIDGGVWVRGSVLGRYEASCRRGLVEIGQPFTFEAAELYRPAGEVWEEGYVINETSIDLGPLVRDTVLLNLPADPLCRQDCAGLCPRCGVNLNEEPHDHEPEVDARWTALKELGGTD
jgi:uncharacterized protein